MGHITLIAIKSYREQGLSFRKIGKIFGVSHARIWNILNNYQWRKTDNGKTYECHRYHFELKDDCSYCELEKRKHALHSKKPYISL